MRWSIIFLMVLVLVGCTDKKQRAVFSFDNEQAEETTNPPYEVSLGDDEYQEFMLISPTAAHWVHIESDNETINIDCLEMAQKKDFPAYCRRFGKVIRGKKL